MNNIKWIGQNILVTCNNWFMAPDGNEYRYVWGKLKQVSRTDDLYGFPTRGSAHANWVVEVGNIVIAGCQVFYSILCPDPPSFGPHKGWAIHDGKILDVEKPNMIYNANDPL